MRKRSKASNISYGSKESFTRINLEILEESKSLDKIKTGMKGGKTVTNKEISQNEI